MNPNLIVASTLATRLTVGLGIALLLSAPALGAGHALKTAQGDLLVPSLEGRSFVQQPDGKQVELPLPENARVSDLRTGGTEWFAAAVAREGGAPALHLLKGRGAEIETLPSPVLAAAPRLAQPLFVADAQELQGIVWLAGAAHNQLAVKAARWLDGHWSEPETVSPPGQGTQIALSTAVLGDGSWLLAWAAFDGQDDEILWSRWSDGAWSTPRPIAEDNAVPDITPHLYPTARGALVAWSRFDGNDYRVNVARFENGTWTAPAVVGPKGSTAPAFSDAATPYLVYHRADPRAWAVMELDDAGSVKREAAIELMDPRRPVIAEVSESAITFEWITIGQKTVSAPLAWHE